MPIVLYLLALATTQDSALDLAKDIMAPSSPAPVSQPAAKPVTEDVRWPVGAPRDDYGLVGWCTGLLGGYVDLYDRVLPDVTRIENAFRKPGTTLAEDMKVYTDLQVESRSNLALFGRAMSAAEQASLQPIRPRGDQAIQKGRQAWAVAANLPIRTVAQQWMGWVLPDICVQTAVRLESNSRLMGAALKTPQPGGSAETQAPEKPQLRTRDQP